MRRFLQQTAFLTIFLAGMRLEAVIPAYEIAGVATGALGIGVSEYYKGSIIPDEPRWKNPPALDEGVRSGLVWSKPNTAHIISNIMVLGVIIPGAVFSPLASNHDYSRSIMTISEAAILTGVLTQVAKFSVARERPYSRFKAQESRGAYDRVSFFSGHTAYSFALSVSTAMLMAESFSDQKALIYGTALGLAAFTGYLRIAADHHYFTDVLVGAIVGSAIAYGIVQMQLSNNASQYGDERRLQLQRVFVLQ